MPELPERFEMPRVYFTNKYYAGRLVSVTNYLSNGTAPQLVQCIVRGLGGDFEDIFFMEDIIVSNRDW